MSSSGSGEGEGAPTEGARETGDWEDRMIENIITKLAERRPEGGRKAGEPSRSGAREGGESRGGA